MPKTFKDLTPQQVENLARKNREKSLNEANEEYEKRGIKKQKKKKQVYVDRSEDPEIMRSSHTKIFTEMQKKPHQN